MGIKKLLQKAVIFLIPVLLAQVVVGQMRIISGTIYDRTARYGMGGVSVRNTSGGGTVTDSAGHYNIKVQPGDSISFSYQGKNTVKFPITDIPPYRTFDMSLHVDVHALPTIVVSATRPQNYHLDSLEFRNEYRKVFDFAPEYLTSGNGGAGVNLDALFSIRKNKRMEAFRVFLEREEREKYIDHRFNKALVQKITGLKSPALDTFMARYRPSYELLVSFETDYEYYRYIKDLSEYFSESWNKQQRGGYSPGELFH
ncbi:hypothetical protein [Chitinophaga sp. 212800010-3]|uniref:hypothetical protein n=1 Tax=unclassified Chitinophaga TaxID=2619133 RepID=UPI002DE2DB88|nr:Carboxypeptidase-like regulatory domain-containing protein [Chitinophaga sp. 212800010-3]